MRMEALNFQYQSLLRYSTAVRRKYLVAEESKRKAAAVAKDSQAQLDALLAENNDLKSRVAVLEKDAAVAAKWSSKMPQITHYLSLWPKAMDEIETLRRQLQQLGYAVPRHDYSMKARQTAKTGAVKERAEQQDFSSTASSNRKRKRSPASKGAMPPPTGLLRSNHYDVPIGYPSKDYSGRKYEQNIQTRRQTQVRSYENGIWNHHDREAAEVNLLAANLGRQTALDEEYTMSGANLQTSPQVTLRRESNPAAHNPRRHHKSDESTHRPAYLQVPETPRIAARKHNLQTGGNFTYQNGVSERQFTEENPQPSRYYEQNNSDIQSIDRPDMRGGQNFVRQRENLQQNSYNRRPLDNREALPGYTTPLPGRIRAPGSVRASKNGSSPFFKRNHHETSSTMPGLSANARIGSVSKELQNVRMTPAQQGWDKPRTLNGLSFIQDPRGTSNEPLLSHRQSNAHNSNYDTYSTQAGTVRRTEDGFFKRPELPQQRLSSSYFQNAPAPAPPTQLPSSLQHASRAQLQPHLPPTSRDPRTVPPPSPAFADHEALRIIRGSSSRNAAATPFFYQNQIFDRGGAERAVANQAPPLQMEPRGLFSSVGRRRSVRR
ncbi:hypothetical protein IWZ03DRAFT_111528 [Phyllosticta citriasiana]|uniref:Uncharacterized protein n=1 Tax=Phyllosticta citriasiana TaxID=595635 RepID=A0ABR1KXK5_9PEZI